MVAKAHAAFKAAGVGEEQAQAAAEELAEFETRFGSVESKLSHMDANLTSLEGKATVLL